MWKDIPMQWANMQKRGLNDNTHGGEANSSVSWTKDLGHINLKNDLTGVSFERNESGIAV